tara:strand:- start:2669 stop:3922 length:1254 start_codon:yes stop_codon:yes gene_type:complete
MPSSYSADLKLELMVTGENAGQWGDNTNTNLKLIQQAIAGYEAVTLSSGGTVALAMTDGALSNARNMVIKFATASIAASTICTIPNSIEKFYIFDCSGLTNPGNLTIKTVSGTGFTPDAAKIYAAYSDGTNITEVSLDTLGGTVGTAQIADDAITAAKISNNAVVTAGILQSNVTQTKLATNAVGTIQILQSNVTQAKLATNSVGPVQLQSTAVTAAQYTAPQITVDEDGRITAATGGSTATPDLIPTQMYKGPSSGTYTADPSTTYVGAYIVAKGGNAGNPQSGFGGLGGRGGDGGFNYFGAPVTAPFSTPYDITGTGNLLTIGQSNGGGGGQPASPAQSSYRGASGAQGTGTPEPATATTYAYAQDMDDNNYSEMVVQITASNTAGQGGYANSHSDNNTKPGRPGIMYIYEDLGT